MALVSFLAQPKPRIPAPRSFFAPKPNGNACYEGYAFTAVTRDAVLILNQHLKGDPFVNKRYTNEVSFLSKLWYIRGQIPVLQKRSKGGIMNADREFYSQTALYGHPLITDSLLCPWGKGSKKAFTFSLNSTRLIRTPG